MTIIARRLAAAAALLVAASAAALAGDYEDKNQQTVPGVAAIPFPMRPVPFGQHNLAPTVATGLTIPSGARCAALCVSGSTGAYIRYRTDGVAPTTGVGMPMPIGACMYLSGLTAMAAFKAIAVSGATLDVEYFQ
jgi:hypothetical protein